MKLSRLGLTREFECKSKKHKNAGKGIIKNKLETEQQTFQQFKEIILPLTWEGRFK
jgi:hypothetical protein